MVYNPNANVNPQAAVKVLPIIHLALIAGQVLFALALLNITPQKGFSFDGSGDPMIYASLALAFGGLTAGNILFTKLLQKIDPEKPLAQKIAAYQSAFILRAALLEGPSLFSLVSYMLSGNLLFLCISGLIVLYFFTFRPSKNKIVNDLSLSYDEKAELEG